MANGATNQILLGSANNSTTVTWGCIVANVVGNGGRAWISNESGNRGFSANAPGGFYTSLTSLIQIGGGAITNPAFIAFSYTDNGPWYGVRTELSTGKILTASGTLGLGTVATDNTFGVTFIGKLWNNNEHATLQIAAFAKTLTQMSQQQMLAWAKDPWSFWYPRIYKRSLVGSAAPPPPPPPDTGPVRLVGLADVDF